MTRIWKISEGETGTVVVGVAVGRERSEVLLGWNPLSHLDTTSFSQYSTSSWLHHGAIVPLPQQVPRVLPHNPGKVM